MRRERITYIGAYHHVMNRGYAGNVIFAGNTHKSHFPDYLEESAKCMKIRIFAYCIMDNHYHLVLENSSGRMSDFLKLLNGQYGMYYRKMEGGKGYVFQSRFKSTIIEDDGYLIKSIEYLLKNPVRAGIVSSAESYTWSSIKYYFSQQESEIVDAGLKYREISEMDIFSGMGFSSLRRLYRLSKERKKEKDRNKYKAINI